MPDYPIQNWIDEAIEADPVAIDLDDIDEFKEVSGPPLSSDDIEAAKASLTQWKTPDKFKAEVDALCPRCPPEVWFNRSALKFLHDAFVLSRFAWRRQVDAVRLAEPAQQWPDGFVQVDSTKHAIEVTSTHGGRKLGREYRNVIGPTIDPVKNWVARGKSIPKFLDEAVRIKSEKRYSSPCWLVLYLNISEYGLFQKETEAAIAEVKARYLSSFEAIFVLWKGRLY